MKNFWLLVGRVCFWPAWPLLWLYVHRSGLRTRVLVTSGDQLLVVKNWLGDGRWVLPGGGVHAKEPPATAAARELREETGLTLSETDLQFKSQAHSATHGIRYEYQLFTVQVEQTGPLQARQWEIAEARWIKRGELHSGNAHSEVLAAIATWPA